MYEAFAEALLKAHQERKVERWVAAGAFWMGRQQIFGEAEFWYAFGAKVMSLLSAEERASLEDQLSKQEDAAIANVGDWPVISSGLQSVMNSWAPAPVEIDLDALRAEATAQVDRSAEAFRMQFITPGFGQVMAYQQKLEEARAKIDNPSIADANIPHIVAEAEATSMSKIDKANEIVATFSAWQSISAGIEAKRMAAKKAISESTTAEAIAVAGQVDWAA
jgi:hypothetical protein